MSDSKPLFVVKLDTPIEFGGATVKELNFHRRIQAKDFRGMGSELGNDENMLMISRLTNMELAVIEQLDGYDYLKAAEVLQLFLSSGPPTGGKPSAK